LGCWARNYWFTNNATKNGDTTLAYYPLYTTGSIVSANQWTHLLFNYNSLVGRIYRNGELLSEYNAGYTPIDYSNPSSLNIPLWYWSNSNFTIDRFRIFNKALTPDETLILKPVSYD
jgi:hypothetical protein